jgi:hypothetical protein
MFTRRRRIGLLGQIGIAAGILTLAGIGAYVIVAETRRRARRRNSVVARAKRAISRNVAQAKTRARARANHFSSARA